MIARDLKIESESLIENCLIDLSVHRYFDYQEHLLYVSG